MKKPYKSVYNTKRYKRWRKRVFIRDHHTCKLCGSRGKQINAHHIKRKVDFPKLTFIASNGITLCEACHHIVTGKEKIFEPLLKKINNKTLSFEYVLSFFAALVKYHGYLVVKFKKSDKWLLIPVALIEIIKSIQESKSKYKRKYLR